MSEMPKFTMSHVGIVVKDLPRMERFIGTCSALP